MSNELKVGDKVKTLDFSNNPPCVMCKKLPGHLLGAVAVYCAEAPYLHVSTTTFSDTNKGVTAGFCQPCSEKVTIKDYLHDARWKKLCWQMKKDFDKNKVRMPKLDRGRSMLSWRPFTVRKKA